MKSLLLFAGLLCLQPTLFANSVVSSDKIRNSRLSASDREQEHFKTHFSDAQDPIWYNQGTENTYCIFHSGDITNRVFYDGRGSWKYTLKSYAPADLKPEVKDLIMNRFGNYAISYVNEVQSDANGPVYVINLENADSIMVVQVAGDDIQISQALTK